MKRTIHLLVICTIVEALQLIRPNAEWSLFGTDYSTLQWSDKIQTKPTQAEISSAISTCQTNEAALANQIQTDLFNLNSSTNTVVQKLPVLIDLLRQKGLLR